MTDKFQPTDYNLAAIVQSPAAVAFLEKTKDPEFCRTIHLNNAEPDKNGESK